MIRTRIRTRGAQSGAETLLFLFLFNVCAVHCAERALFRTGCVGGAYGCGVLYMRRHKDERVWKNGGREDRNRGKGGQRGRAGEFRAFISNMPSFTAYRLSLPAYFAVHPSVQSVRPCVCGCVGVWASLFFLRRILLLRSYEMLYPLYMHIYIHRTEMGWGKCYYLPHTCVPLLYPGVFG